MARFKYRLLFPDMGCHGSTAEYAGAGHAPQLHVCPASSDPVAGVRHQS